MTANRYMHGEPGRIITRTTELVPAVLQEAIPDQEDRGDLKPGDFNPRGNCVHSSMVVRDVLRHYGLDAETVPVSVVVEADHGESGIVSIPTGNFAGHMVTRVRFPGFGVLIDLTLQQFSDPSAGINPPPVAILGAPADRLDTVEIAVTPPGHGQIRYRLRPEMDDWQQLAAGLVGFDEAGHRQRIREMAEIVISRMREMR